MKKYLVLTQKTHIYIWWSRRAARHFVKQPQAKSIYRAFIMGRRIQMSSLLIVEFFLPTLLKVVVVQSRF